VSTHCCIAPLFALDVLVFMLAMHIRLHSTASTEADELEKSRQCGKLVL
jgi:hypothetical protein